MRKLLLFLLLATAAWAQNDPCFSASGLKKSVPVNITTATTTQLVPLVSGQQVYVCNGFVSIATSATTADTVQFEYGTGSNCGTGTTALTGTIGNGTATTPSGVPAFPLEIPAASTSFLTPSGQALCIVTAGTTVNVQGWITYIQQ